MLTILGTNNKISNLTKFKACADKNKCDSKAEVCSGMIRKHCGKRRKCWLPAFSPFHNFFESFLS